MKPKLRTGTGFDVHQLAAGRRLVLGGIDIPWSSGCVAHSDGDVLIHSICDALLGAAGLGDIGRHFPDTDQKFKDIDSTILLREVHRLITGKGYEVCNIDTVICLQEPKLGKFIPSMQERLAGILGIEPEDVSIKATTTEKLGYVGRGEGISAHAVVLLSGN
jgi:2-C-methyl-D-erythritol 2,4-cyclodiphosphate synthase